MPAATPSATPIEETELPSMIATLCSYESWFGPYHPQTLALTVQVAMSYGRAGELILARRLSERVVRDLGRHLGREHPETMDGSEETPLRDGIAADHWNVGGRHVFVPTGGGTAIAMPADESWMIYRAMTRAREALVLIEKFQ